MKHIDDITYKYHLIISELGKAQDRLYRKAIKKIKKHNKFSSQDEERLFDFMFNEPPGKVTFSEFLEKY